MPEDAVADAAQPLEDLEDHRRNVTALEQTDRALAGVLDAYRSYARHVLRAAAGRTDARLAGLKGSPAYRDHQALLARRDHVASLHAQSAGLDEQRARARHRVETATTRVAARRQRVDGDLQRISAALTELGRHGCAAATTLPLPDPPALRVLGRTDAASGAGIEVPDGDDPLAAVRTVLDAGTADPGSRSRTEIAAQLLGDAHALDSSAPLVALVTRAPAVRAMTAAGLPLHLSTAALRAAPLVVPPGTVVLVVENPRLVQAAAQRRLPAPVLTTGGNPATAPSLAITQLAAAGAVLRHHGDFDAAGLAIATRAAAAGAAPRRMDRADYLVALQHAADNSVTLPHDPAPAPATPWDPALAAEFDRRREIVHEERVMDALLAEHARTAFG